MDPIAPVPSSELARRALLRSLDVLDSPAEAAFDALVRTASLVCRCPVSLLSLVDEKRQWFKSAVGLDVAETPREQAFCAHAIEGEGLFEIPDALDDERFVDNPLVTGETGIRFYAGHPLVFDGVALGTLCVIDRKPRVLDDEQKTVLANLSLAAVELLNGRREAILHRREAEQLRVRDRELALTHDALRVSECRVRAVTDNVPALIVHFDANERFCFANAAARHIFGPDLLGRTILEVHGPQTYAEFKPNIERVFAGERVIFEGRRLVDGKDREYEAIYVPDFGSDGVVRGFYAISFNITERKHAETRLAASERMLRGITDNLPALVSYIDRHHRYRFANATYRTWLGHDHHAMIGRPVRDYFEPKNVSELMPYLARAWSGERVQYERHDTDDGRDVHHLVDYIPDVDEDGTVLGLYVMSIDITRIKKAEKARAQADQRLRDITDNLPVLITHIDVDERMTYANDTFLDWVGTTRERMIGCTVAEAIGPALYAQREGYIRRALAGERITFELDSVSGGQAKHLQATYLPDVDADGRVVGLTTLSVDVTALKEAQLRLSQLAHFDALTGLPNRLQFDSRLAEFVAAAAADGADLRALMFLDIDHFKSINDTHGHATGDAVLKRFSARLQASVRATDFVARLSGDEFVVLLAGLSDEAEAEAIARKVVRGLDHPMNVTGRSLQVTASVGIALFGRTAEPGSEVMARADAALYRAKEAGRNTFRLAA